jgi:heat shock protein HslJ
MAGGNPALPFERREEVPVGRIAVASAVLTAAGLLVLPACSSPSRSTAVLTNVEWQWTLFTVTSPASQTEVPDPTRYTISFEEGGRIQIKADCNSGSGTYETDGAAMRINVTTITFAQCPEGSMSEDFMAELRAVDTYHLEDGRLALEPKDDAGEMRLLDGGAAPRSDVS